MSHSSFINDLLDARSSPPSMGGGRNPFAGSLQHTSYIEGLELSYLRQPDRLCLGLIGTTEVCCAAQGTYAIKKYRDARASLPSGGELLFRCTARGSAQPCCLLASSLSTAGMEDELIEEFLAGSGQERASTFEVACEENIKTKADCEQESGITAPGRKVVVECRSPPKIEAHLAADALLDSVTESAGMLRGLLVDKSEKWSIPFT